MSQESYYGRIIFRWTASKREIIAVASYIIIAVFIEYLVTATFMNFGLTEELMLTWRIPLLNDLTVSISPVLHLVPLTVVFTLVFSWMHITKYVIYATPKLIKIEKIVKKKKGEKRALKVKTFKEKTSYITNFPMKISNFLKLPFLKIWEKLGLARLSQFLREQPFASASIKGAFAVLATFLTFMVLTCLLENPDTIYHLIIIFYQRNPALLDFVYGTHIAINSISEMLGPALWVPSTINKSLLDVAPYFRKTIDTSLRPLFKVFTSLNITTKYLICQNVASWTSAFTSILYGRFKSKSWKTVHRS
ncbi:TPA: hypothetical protein EYP70_08255 [Candidatus Bathyarchaeota archaeon]|nr:hypothetical protein [Candidatus Bathyarchaeota archaeon]